MIERVPPQQSVAAGVVLAGGSGTRVGGELNKVYLPLAGRRLVSWSLEAFLGVSEIGVLVLVDRPQDGELVDWILDREIIGEVEVVHGGEARQASELAALRHLAGRIDAGLIDTVLLHDAARPLISPKLISGVLHAAREHGGAIPGLSSGELATLSADNSELTGVVPDHLVSVQTPQGFHAASLLAAYEEAARLEFNGTDTAACMEQFSSTPVHWVRGEQRNLKITYPQDLVFAEHILASSAYQVQ